MSHILGLLSEIPSAKYRTQIGLQLRETKLVNGMLFNTEAWSSISDRELLRMEQADFSLMRALIGGSHSKCPIEFYLLELGLFKLRHIIMRRRIVYHHHIITRNKNETIRKIYNKQKESVGKGDWYETLMKDVEFIREVMEDKIIMKIDKIHYKKLIHTKVEKAAIASYMKRKQEKLTKLQDIQYSSFEIQPYFTCLNFGPKEIRIMSLLGSKSHPAKSNF